ncbi:hypothetical protein BDF20DRAFT_831668 [Mycotypha africana]|uniref:uncharacterized protein n=1 Tax=Mycotypha africana TaxID=64632 RepID=UPI0022FFD52B|nr:uncharacterized protein BDF20DRAFT_831668 [Mycotypha africana]KAI8991648.1 hypothetical protein BDF20DRAFT_831668 [Mycotypha africana]
MYDERLRVGKDNSSLAKESKGTYVKKWKRQMLAKVKQLQSYSSSNEPYPTLDYERMNIPYGSNLNVLRTCVNQSSCAHTKPQAKTRQCVSKISKLGLNSCSRYRMSTTNVG